MKNGAIFEHPVDLFFCGNDRHKKSAGSAS